jgi:hypothetical protein
MTGLWHGTYVYPSFQGPTTPFVASLDDQGGHIGGTTLEPNLQSIPGEPEELNATLVGTRKGRSIDFIKTYDGEVFNDSIDYVGQLSNDGTTVTGVWSNNDMDGTFEMHRDISLEEVTAVETGQEVDAELPN